LPSIILNKLLPNIILNEGVLVLKLYGMIHLPPLPGSAGYGGQPISEIIDYAMSEAEKLVEAGFDGFVIENYMDYPFPVRQFEGGILASIDDVTRELREQFSRVEIGLNILRNSAIEALEIACRNKLDFIRINAYMEPVWAPEGLMMPLAYWLTRERRNKECKTQLYADVNVKHSRPILDYLTALKNTVWRGRPDGIIVTGEATGSETSPMHVYVAWKYAAPRRIKVIVGSGVNEENIGLYIGYTDAVIVGTSIKEKRVTVNPIDKDRARRLVVRARSLEKILTDRSRASQPPRPEAPQ
jgi:membrane complex biogenesis BtpA family protein